MKQAVGLAKSEHDAERAVAKLSETGFDAESITVLGDVGAFWQTLGCTPAEIVATDFGIGAALGLLLVLALLLVMVLALCFQTNAPNVF